MIAILNQQKIDYGINYHGLVQDLLLYQINQVKYQSIEVAKENLRSLCELFIEGFTLDKDYTKDKKQKKEIGNLIRRINNLIKFDVSWQSTEKMISSIFNFVLS